MATERNVNMMFNQDSKDRIIKDMIDILSPIEYIQDQPTVMPMFEEILSNPKYSTLNHLYHGRVPTVIANKLFAALTINTNHLDDRTMDRVLKTPEYLALEQYIQDNFIIVV